MTRYELRWLRRHPSRWLGVWWLHVTVACLLGILAAAWEAPIFAQVVGASAWPLLLSWVAGLVIASALAPFSPRLVAICGGALITVGIVRALSLAEVWLHGTASRPVVAALAVHALLIAALGTMWPDWTAACASRTAVEAGRDDRGGGGA